MDNFPQGLTPDDEDKIRLAQTLQELNKQLKGLGTNQVQIYKQLSHLDEGYVRHIADSMKAQTKHNEKLFSHLLYRDKEELKLFKAMMGVLENHSKITQNLLDVTKKNEQNLINFVDRMNSPAYQRQAKDISNEYGMKKQNLQDSNFGESMKDILSDKSTGFAYSTIASMLFGSNVKTGQKDKNGKDIKQWVRRQGADSPGSNAYTMREKQDTLQNAYTSKYNKFRDNEYAKSVGVDDYAETSDNLRGKQEQYWRMAYDASLRKGKGNHQTINASGPADSSSITPLEGGNMGALAQPQAKLIGPAFDPTPSSEVHKETLIGLPRAYAEPALAIIDAIENCKEEDEQVGRLQGGGGSSGSSGGGIDIPGMLKNLLPLIAGAIPALLPIILGGGAIALIMKMFSDQGKRQAEEVADIQKDWTPAMKEAFNKEFQGAIPTRMDAEAFETENKGNPISVQTSARTNEIAGNAVFTSSGTQDRINNSVQASQATLQSQGLDNNPYDNRGLQWKIESESGRDTYYVRKGNTDAWIGITPNATDLARLSQLAIRAYRERKLPASAFFPRGTTPNENQIRTLERQMEISPTPVELQDKVLRGKGPQTFDKGGIVPGPIGQAVPATVHAGETVVPTHKESVRRNLDTLINDNIQSTANNAKLEELMSKVAELQKALLDEMKKNTTVTEELGSKKDLPLSPAPSKRFTTSVV